MLKILHSTLVYSRRSVLELAHRFNNFTIILHAAFIIIIPDQAFSTPVEDSKIFCPLTATEKMNTIFLLSIEFTGCFKFYFPDCVT